MKSVLTSNAKREKDTFFHECRLVNLSFVWSLFPVPFSGWHWVAEMQKKHILSWIKDTILLMYTYLFQAQTCISNEKVKLG